MTADREPSGSPVTAVRRSTRGPSAGLALLVVIGAIAAAIGLALANGPGPAPSPVAVVSASPTATAQRHPVATIPAPVIAPPTPAIAPVPASADTVLVLRDVADPAGTLAALTGCSGSARTRGQTPFPPIKGSDVDTIAADAGRGPGSWLFVPPGIQASTRVWLGDDLVALAAAVGQPVVAVGPKGEVWLGGPAGATRWYPIATPQGRTAWVMGADSVAGTGRCGPWTVPSEIAGLRSLTCAAVGEPTCLNLLPLVNADVTGVLQPGGDLVVAVPPCIDSNRCFATPLTFIGLPPAWSGSLHEVRAVAANDYSGTLVPVTADMLPAYAIEALGRPGLPLPTGGDKVKGNTCGETLTGQLHGSPWDPRVAWVGDTAVVWPTGTTLRFLPFAQLTAPGDPYGTFAAQYDPLTVTGMLNETGLAFNACRVALAPFAASSGSGETPAVTPGPLSGRGTGG